MRNWEKGNSLMEDLSQKSGCCYLSDLRFGMYDDAVTAVLKETTVEQYPEQDWQQALCYIIGEFPRVSASEARIALLAYFMGRTDRKNL